MRLFHGLLTFLILATSFSAFAGSGSVGSAAASAGNVKILTCDNGKTLVATPPGYTYGGLRFDSNSRSASGLTATLGAGATADETEVTVRNDDDTYFEFTICRGNF